MRWRNLWRNRGARAASALTLLLAAFACRPVLAQPGPTGANPFPDLPLVEFPVPHASPVMALVMSGDGNWASFIRQFSDTLNAEGIPVVGLESRAYLATPKNPDTLTRDLEPVIRYYLKAWSAEGVLVVGYSRGADFAPFLVNRLPADLRARVRAVALLSPSKSASFEFHFMDLLKFTPRPTDLPAVPQVEKLAPVPVICIFGTQDKESLCPLLPPGMAELLPVDSGHRLHGPGPLARAVLSEVADRFPLAGRRDWQEVRAPPSPAARTGRHPAVDPGARP